MAFQHSFCVLYCHHLLCIDLLIETNLNLRVYRLFFAFMFLKRYSLAVKEKIVILDSQIYYFYFCHWKEFPHNKPVLVILSPASFKLSILHLFRFRVFLFLNFGVSPDIATVSLGVPFRDN